MIIEKDKSLRELNTFGIEAKAMLFAEYASIDELRKVLTDVRDFCKENMITSCPILHIGGGSNLLFTKDYDGLVLHSAVRDIEVLEDDAQKVKILVGAGIVWDDFVAYALNNGWYGLENLTAIPGEVGAAAVQNIGAYGVEAKDFISAVHLVDLFTLEERVMSHEELDYGYRYSALKSKSLWGKYAVTHVEFVLHKNFVPNLDYGGLKNAVSNASHFSYSYDNGIGKQELTANILRDIIKELRDGKLPDPKVLGNAGSFFMNPVVTRDVFENLISQYSTMPHYEVDAGHVKIPAGWLIEQAGWKGRSMGRAGVYERQALVLVNLGEAKGQDIIDLCELVRADVHHKFGITIHPEVNFI